VNEGSLENFGVVKATNLIEIGKYKFVLTGTELKPKENESAKDCTYFVSYEPSQGVTYLEKVLVEKTSNSYL